ncbi:MAG TPA: diacylglycerol kinase family protein [Chloroflexota bacterium]|nr:diacylglycerol kinase family protein [Chloroflexota bacterium]HEX2988681.1 diacylglycerol kinase family protein [Chloroflexota bacterium]
MSRSLYHSFANAFHGLSYALRYERNPQIHLAMALATVAVGLWLGLAPFEWAILVLTISAVLATELLNSALETLADATSPEYHPLVGIAKDVAAGAVLVIAIGAVAVGLLLFLPKLIAILDNIS